MNGGTTYRMYALALLLVFSVAGTLGGTYVVSPQGNDNNPGTLDQPWQTIGKANRTLQPGDTVLVREGSYPEQIKPDRSGANGRHIVYAAMPGENPVVEGEPGNLVVVVASSYCVIEGFTIRCQAHLKVLQKPEYWVHIVGNYITLRRCRILADGDAYENYGTLKDFSRGVVVAGANNIIENCYIRGQSMGVVISGLAPRFTILRSDTMVNNGSSNVVILPYDNQGSFDDRIQGTLIEDCVMDTSWDEDNIQFEPNYLDHTRPYNNGVIIRRCKMGHAAENCIDFKGAGNVLVDQCLLFGSEGDNNGRYDGADEVGGAGLNLGAGEVSQYVTVRRTVIWDNHGGAYMYDGYRYYNNVFLNNRRSYRGPNGNPPGNGYSAAEIWNRPTFRRAFLNNIIGMQPNLAVLNLDLDGGGNFYMNNNLYFGPDAPVKFYHSMTDPKTMTVGLANWQAILNTYSGYAYLGGKEANSIEADPLFINVPLYPTDYDEGWNFGLTQNSPGVDAGRPVTNTVGDGNGSQTLRVDDARFFCDGYGVTDGDLIKIGSGDPVRIIAIDTTANEITLESPRSWSNGDGVHLDFEGAAPDIGAFEFISGAPQPPSTPGLSAPADGASGLGQPVELSWGSTAATLVYYPQVAADAGFRTIVVNPGAVAEPRYVVSGLDGGATYYWRVRSGNGAGVSSWSPVRSFTTAQTIPNPPATPELLSPPSGATDLVQPVELSWASIAAATAYYPQVALDAGFGTVVFNPGAVTATSFSASGLDAGTTYYWRVRSGNDGGVSDWSPVRSFATRPNTPDAPAAPVLLSPGAGASGLGQEVELRWTKTAATLAYYPQVSVRSSFDSLVADPGAVVDTTYTASGLEAGRTFYWRVRSGNQGGVSVWSATRSFATRPATPGTPVASLPASGSAGVTTNPLLTWTSTSGAASYRVQVAESSTFESLLFDQQVAGATSYLVEGLKNGVTYYWRVVAIGPGGNSDWSIVSTFTTFEFSQGAQGNVLQNPGFQGGLTGWDFVGAASATVSVAPEGYRDSSSARISITSLNGPIELFQDNVVLNPDSGYSVSFAARSSSGHDCEVSVMKSSPPYTNYGINKTRIDLGTAWKVFSLHLDPGGMTAPVNDGRLLFDFGTYAAAGDVVLLDQVAVMVGDGPASPDTPPKDYFLEENYPNPFNPNTTIRYSLPADGRVVVKVINLLGQEILRLVDEYQTRGKHEVVLDLHGYASGTYLVTLIAGEYMQTRKVMMVK